MLLVTGTLAINQDVVTKTKKLGSRVLAQDQSDELQIEVVTAYGEADYISLLVLDCIDAINSLF